MNELGFECTFIAVLMFSMFSSLANQSIKRSDKFGAVMCLLMSAICAGLIVYTLI